MFVPLLVLEVVVLLVVLPLLVVEPLVRLPVVVEPLVRVPAPLVRVPEVELSPVFLVGLVVGSLLGVRVVVVLSPRVAAVKVPPVVRVVHVGSGLRGVVLVVGVRVVVELLALLPVFREPVPVLRVVELVLLLLVCGPLIRNS